MNSNLKPQVDAHQISLDLEGLDDFLESSQHQVEVAEEESQEKSLLLQLMDRVVTVNQSVEEARERLSAANERMSALHTVVQVQTGQLELLSHYQNQAARVTSLERQINQLQEENARLKQSWFNKLLALFQR
ncbi:MAG TPA: hypothetical protein V6C72_17170 [Chroococcales cyanobacterium]